MTPLEATTATIRTREMLFYLSDTGILMHVEFLCHDVEHDSSQQAGGTEDQDREPESSHFLI